MPWSAWSARERNLFRMRCAASRSVESRLRVRRPFRYTSAWYAPFRSLIPSGSLRFLGMGCLLVLLSGGYIFGPKKKLGYLHIRQNILRPVDESVFLGGCFTADEQPPTMTEVLNDGF